MKERSITLKELASLTDAKLQGDPEKRITGVADLDKATNSQVSFLANPRYANKTKTSSAGALFVEQILEGLCCNYLVTKDPSKSFQKAIEYFFVSPDQLSSYSTGIHPTAVIDPSAILGDGVSIGPYAVIDKEVVIGKKTHISASVFIGAGTTIGEQCLLHPHVTVREKCKIGSRVILQPGAVIGACGFGYATSNQGIHTKLDQLSFVEIEDDVEVGANSTIDRGRFQPTRICKGTKIDNLVMIGHGVEIGPHNLLVAQSGIAGSTKTGSNCVLAAQAGVAGHLDLEDGVVIAAKSGVNKSLKKGVYSGIPVQEIQASHRTVVHQKKLSEYVKRLQNLEKRLEELEKKHTKTLRHKEPRACSAN